MTWPSSFVNKVVCADALDGLRQIPDGVIQCCVTSPPYWGLRDYGTTGQIGLESTPEEYVAKMVEVFREVRRVLKDDGTLWLNLGDSYVSARGRWSSVAQTISGHSRNEPVDGNRPDQIGHPYLKDKDLAMTPARVALALQADGWYLRSVIIWNKPSCMPESVTDRPTTSHEYVYLLAKSADYFCDMEAIREPYTEPLNRYGGDSKKTTDHLQDGSPYSAAHRERDMRPNPGGRNKRTVWTINPEPTPYAHFATFPQKLVEPCIMAGTSEKGNCGKCGKPWVRVVERPDMSQRPTRAKGSKMDTDAVHISNNWQGVPKSAGQAYQNWRNANPNKTLGWQASCSCGIDPVPPIVLDCFSGSGTVGVVAKKLLRNYVLIDLNPEYNEKIAKPRLAQSEMQLK